MVIHLHSAASVASLQLPQVKLGSYRAETSKLNRWKALIMHENHRTNIRETKLCAVHSRKHGFLLQNALKKFHL